MKTIGLIGGMSWESSAEYYRIINQTVKERLGGLHSAQVVMYSVDFADIAELQHAGRWADAARLLVDAAKRLEAGGADLVLLCTNTMHKVAEQLASAISIPLVHIADPTGEAIKARGVHTIALLGTGFTMEQDFYKARLAERYGLRVIVPDEADRKVVHEVIYQELCLGQIRPESRAAYRDIMARLVGQGAEAIILGCTEIGLLVRAEDATVPLFDTAHLHALKAVDLALDPR
ncbi:MAG: aspartate/glutamate racemase family protein [Firmicutes bacterium]|nr:aspartate/glutamate racemase family protein [Bacillota bacterium]